MNKKNAKEMSANSIYKHVSVWLSTRISSAWRSEVFIHQEKAIRGYDPVAFFIEGKMVVGLTELALSWRGVLWLFSTPANRDIFEAQPEKYAPQYGGFCAFGVSRGYKAHTDLSTWVIIENRLYFSYNKKVRNTWEENFTDFIKEADKQWAKVKNTPVKYTLPLLALLSAALISN